MKLKYYIFDWDDNILNMETKINMEKFQDGQWIPVEVSTKDFAHIRYDSNYRLPGNNDTQKAFMNFRDSGKNKDDNFLIDVDHALKKQNFGVSFEHFKECLKEGRLFAIVTARGHSTENIKRGVLHFIEEIFTSEDYQKMEESLKFFLYKFKDNKDVYNFDQLLNYYLDNCEFLSVTNPEFLKKHNINPSEIEKGKELAIKNFVYYCYQYSQKISDYQSISVGFSDDDPKNLSAIKDLFEKELDNKFEEIKFNLFNTSQGQKEKIEI